MSVGSSAVSPIDLTVSDVALTKKINAIIKRGTESKSSFGSLPTTAYNSGMNSSGDIVFCCPNIGQGTAENERIGDEVKAQKLKIQGILTMNLTYGAAASATRLGVRILIVQPKAYSSVGIIQAEAATWLGTLLKKGGVDTGFTGITSDLYAPINTNAITCYYDKVHYMTIPYLTTSVGASETQFSTKFFTADLKLRNKILKYSTPFSGGISAINYNPVILCGYVHLDGSSPDTVNAQVSMSFISSLMYEDA